MDIEERRRTKRALEHKASALAAETMQLGEIEDKSPEQTDRLHRQHEAFKRTEHELAKVEKDVEIYDKATAAHRAGTHKRGTPDVRPLDAGEEFSYRTHELGRALRSVESNTLVSDEATQAAVLTLERNGSDRRLASYAEAAGSEIYLRSFIKLLSDPEKGSMLWDNEERTAFARAQEEMRSLSVGVDTAGGYATPLMLDPTVINTEATAINPMRRLARHVQISTEVWNGVQSEGMNARWAAELSEAPDSQPTFSQPTIATHRADVFTSYSIELGQDWGQLAEELTTMFRDARDELEAAAHMTGTGVGQPQGLLTGLAAAPATANVVVPPATGGVFASGDIRAMWSSLRSGFRAEASWLADGPTNAAIQAMGNGADADFTTSFRDNGVQVLMGRSVNESEHMGDQSLVFGDIARAYRIVDRIGMNVELVPLIMGANQRPIGARGLFAHWRTGGGVLNPQAARTLKI